MESGLDTAGNVYPSQKQPRNPCNWMVGRQGLSFGKAHVQRALVGFRECISCLHVFILSVFNLNIFMFLPTIVFKKRCIKWKPTFM